MQDPLLRRTAAKINDRTAAHRIAPWAIHTPGSAGNRATAPADKKAQAVLQKRLRRYKTMLADVANALHYIGDAAGCELRPSGARRRGTRAGKNKERRHEEQLERAVDKQRGVDDHDDQRYNTQVEQDRPSIANELARVGSVGAGEKAAHKEREGSVGATCSGYDRWDPVTNPRLVRREEPPRSQGRKRGAVGEDTDKKRARRAEARARKAEAENKELKQRLEAAGAGVSGDVNGCLETLLDKKYHKMPLLSVLLDLEGEAQCHRALHGTREQENKSLLRKQKSYEEALSRQKRATEIAQAAGARASKVRVDPDEKCKSLEEALKQESAAAQRLQKQVAELQDWRRHAELRMDEKHEALMEQREVTDCLRSEVKLAREECEEVKAKLLLAECSLECSGVLLAEAAEARDAAPYLPTLKAADRESGGASTGVVCAGSLAALRGELELKGEKKIPVKKPPVKKPPVKKPQPRLSRSS